MTMRSLESADYDLIAPVVDGWWGGRPVRALHQRMGFSLVRTGAEQDGIPVSLHHAGEGQHRVLFRRSLARETTG